MRQGQCELAGRDRPASRLDGNCLLLGNTRAQLDVVAGHLRTVATFALDSVRRRVLEAQRIFGVGREGGGSHNIRGLGRDGFACGGLSAGGAQALAILSDNADKVRNARGEVVDVQRQWGGRCPHERLAAPRLHEPGGAVTLETLALKRPLGRATCNSRHGEPVGRDTHRLEGGSRARVERGLDNVAQRLHRGSRDIVRDGPRCAKSVDTRLHDALGHLDARVSVRARQRNILGHDFSLNDRGRGIPCKACCFDHSAGVGSTGSVRTTVQGVAQEHLTAGNLDITADRHVVLLGAVSAQTGE